MRSLGQRKVRSSIKPLLLPSARPAANGHDIKLVINALHPFALEVIEVRTWVWQNADSLAGTVCSSGFLTNGCATDWAGVSDPPLGAGAGREVDAVGVSGDAKSLQICGLVLFGDFALANECVSARYCQ